MDRDTVKEEILRDLKGLTDGRYFTRVSKGLGQLFREMEQNGLIKINKVLIEGRKHRITQVIALMEKLDG
jgi:hypothetical protein